MNSLTNILRGFADTQVRMIEATEREVHHHASGERPEGEGWIRIPHKDYDPSGYALWERTKYVRAAT